MRYRSLVVIVVLGLIVSVLATPSETASATTSPDDCTIVGTEGADFLAGTNQDDVICGLGGDDVIEAGNGSDVVFGGAGDDSIVGGNGDDILYGDDGDDEIQGENGADVVFGGSGSDSIDGGTGDDALSGEAGNDELIGDKGDDVLVGSAGVDSADGGQGYDSCASESTIDCEELVPDLGGAPEEVAITSPTDGGIVFSDTAIIVSVTPSEAEGSIRVEIDGVPLPEVEIDGGVARIDWDTTQFSDGSKMIDVTAIDTQGQDVASVSLNVDVDNSLDASGRLATDFESGSIDTSTYVEFGLMSLYAFELLPERYAASFADPEAEGNGLIIEYLSLWDQLDQATQQRLGDAVEATMILDFGTAFGLWDPGAAATASASASSTALDLSAWPECFDTFSGDVACTHISDNFEIYYVPVGLAGSNVASGVSETDVLNRTGTVVTSCGATCNQVPDYVDRVAAALEQAWDTYGDLEFRLPSSPVRVSILNTRAHTFPNPIPFLQAGIALNNRNDQFSTARHEMFHMVQYEYAGILDLARDGVLAWLEATAEWGAHQAAQPDDNLGIVNRDTPYYNRVGAFLSRPNWSALTYEDVIPLLNPFRNQQRQYGAFLLAEHLEESLAPPAADTTVIEATWQEIDAGHSAATALSNVIAANSPFGWSEQEQLVDFHIDALVLSNQGSVGFGDSDVALWKGQLASPPFGSGILALPNERVLSAEHDFGVSDLWDPGVTERPFVASGGSAYASMGLRDQGGVPLQGTLVIEAPALTDLAYTVVMFDGYPNLCPAYPDPFRIDTGVGTAGFVMIDLDGTCDEAVLVISHTDYELGFSGNLEPGTFGNGVQTDWMAEHLSCSEPLEYGVDILGDASFENHLGNVATGPDGEVFPGEIAAGAAPWPLAWADGSYTNDANHTDWAVFTNNGVQGSFPLPPARWSISTNAPRTGISHAQTTVGLNFGGSSHQLIPIGFPMCRDAGDFSPTLAGFNGVWTARVQPGDTIDWSVWAKVDTAASSPDVDMWFEIWTEDLTTSVYDDGTFYFNGELGQSYSEFTHTAVAPADSYYLIAYVQFSHPDFDTIIDVDDARLSLTPAGP